MDTSHDPRIAIAAAALAQVTVEQFRSLPATTRQRLENNAEL